MKRISRIFAVVMALCLCLSLGAFAATYTDGSSTMEVADDGTFTMTTAGENMDGAAFALTVTGTVGADGAVTITGVFDGDIDLTSLASEDQLAGNLATAQALLGGGAAASAGIVPGTYTDGSSTMEVAADGTFTMTTAGENMDGAAFELTVTGTVGADGAVTITGVFDGDIDLTELASEDQLAENLATAEALYAQAGSGEPSGESSGEPSGEGTYTDGKNTLELAADGSFVMTKGGENMDGAAFVLTVYGTYANGKVTVTGLFDGDMDLSSLATEDQLAADAATALALIEG